MQTLFTGDPSTTVQYFPRVSIKIHCCRYWWLKNWEYSTLSFPFWRIYHNTGVGGVIEYRGTTYRMETNKVYLIAPNTDYSSRIEGNSIPRRGNCLCGGNLGALAESEREQLLANRPYATLSPEQWANIHVRYRGFFERSGTYL